VDAWLAQLSAGDAVAGPPVAKLRDRIPASVLQIGDAERASWSPAAEDVGRLAAALHQRGVAVDPLALVPNYYRRSAAEENKSSGSLPLRGEGWGGGG
jgi:hypothetical protein